MTRRFYQRLLAGLFVGALLLAAPQQVSATIVFDDHFTGGSGGMPANWSRLYGTGSVVESGTTVTLGEAAASDDVIIGSDATMDPGSGVVTIETEFTGIVGQGASGLIAGSTFPSALFFCAIRLEDGRIEVNAGSPESGGEYYDVVELVGYTGGPIRLTVVLGPTWFSVATDSPPFSSGPIEYTAAFSDFTREDLGSAASVMLFDYGDPGCTIVDRIMVDVEGLSAVEEPVVEDMSIGMLKALFRQ